MARFWCSLPIYIQLFRGAAPHPRAARLSLGRHPFGAVFFPLPVVFDCAHPLFLAVQVVLVVVITVVECHEQYESIPLPKAGDPIDAVGRASGIVGISTVKSIELRKRSGLGRVLTFGHVVNGGLSELGNILN